MLFRSKEKSKEVAILDIGSRKITCMVAERGFDGDFVIKASGQSLYNGFRNGEFFEPDKLSDCISFAIKQAQEKLGKAIKSLCVGVPGEFCVVATSEASTTFHSKKRIEDHDLKELATKANVFKNVGNSKNVEVSPIYFVVDNVSKTYEPVGVVANKISGLYSFTFADKYFLKKVENSLKQAGVYDYSFVNGCSAEATYLASAFNKQNKCILFDVGHISTNVMVSEGEGLVFQYTFSLGSGYIAGDLCQLLNISFDRAMQLLNKVNLNLEFAENDNYTLSDGVMVQAELSNKVVKARIEQFAEYIKKSFAYCDKPIDSNIALLLTGGGLSYIKGADEYLSACLGKTVTLVENSNPQHNKNEYSSSYGLIEKAFKKPVKRGFWRK
ncbi:MAG: hypothetical protein J6R37_03420 [Clostridia bacterium]|nr:hypothetical protein [Clostridia bacterium]